MNCAVKLKQASCPWFLWTLDWRSNQASLGLWLTLHLLLEARNYDTSLSDTGAVGTIQAQQQAQVSLCLTQRPRMWRSAQENIRQSTPLSPALVPSCDDLRAFHLHQGILFSFFYIEKILTKAFLLSLQVKTTICNINDHLPFMSER